jgi:hypothetical protein
MEKKYVKPILRSELRLPGPQVTGGSVHLSTTEIPRPHESAAIWVVDGTHDFWDALTWMDQFNSLTQKIACIQDMVDICKNYASGVGQGIDFLAIFGHGDSGHQSVGGHSEPNDQESGTRSLTVPYVGSTEAMTHLVGPAASLLAPLNDSLSSDAQVLLAGCKTGADVVGTRLLTIVSGILNGRAVCGFEESTYWWTGVLTGTLKVARGSSISEGFVYLKIGRYSEQDLQRAPLADRVPGAN